MAKTKALVKEKANEYISEIQRRLPGVHATYDAREHYDFFDGIIRVRGPYNEADDAEQIQTIDGLAMDFNEWYGIDFLVLYEQEQLAQSQI